MTVASHGAELESSSLQPASIHFTCENKNHTQISSHHRHDRDRSEEQESKFLEKKITISPTTSVRGIETCTKKKLHISRRPPRSVLVFVRVFQICCVFFSSVLKLQQQSRNSFISRWKKRGFECLHISSTHSMLVLLYRETHWSTSEFFPHSSFA